MKSKSYFLKPPTIVKNDKKTEDISFLPLNSYIMPSENSNFAFAPVFFKPQEVKPQNRGFRLASYSSGKYQ